MHRAVLGPPLKPQLSSCNVRLACSLCKKGVILDPRQRGWSSRAGLHIWVQSPKVSYGSLVCNQLYSHCSPNTAILQPQLLLFPSSLHGCLCTNQSSNCCCLADVGFDWTRLVPLHVPRLLKACSGYRCPMIHAPYILLHMAHSLASVACLPGRV